MSYKIRLTLEFPGKEEMKAWAKVARQLGLLPSDAGIVRADTLDMHRRVKPGEYVVRKVDKEGRRVN